MENEGGYIRDQVILARQDQTRLHQTGLDQTRPDLTILTLKELSRR